MPFFFDSKNIKVKGNPKGGRGGEGFHREGGKSMKKGLKSSIVRGRANSGTLWETPKEVINVQINRDCQNSKVLMQC